MNDSLKEKFDSEIKAHPVVIYMKGNAFFPRCGFSSMALELLKKYSTPHVVDVLADPEVREGIKVYSNWPTIPQVYIHGNFVGGSDIVRELEERGELKSLIQG